MKKIIVAVMLFCGLVLAGPAEAKFKDHAIPKAFAAVGKGVKASPKVTFGVIAKSAGSVVFGFEWGVDILHGGTAGLSKAAGMELKHNPFVYPDKVVGYLDTGTEKLYLALWHVQI